MKRIAVLFFICISFYGCGTTNSGTSPVISNLRWTPLYANLGDGGGSISAVGMIDYFDNDADFKYIYVESTNGKIKYTFNTSSKEGIAQSYIEIPTNARTTHVFSVYAVDISGNKSNTINGSFEVK